MLSHRDPRRHDGMWQDAGSTLWCVIVVAVCFAIMVCNVVSSHLRHWIHFTYAVNEHESRTVITGMF